MIYLGLAPGINWVSIGVALAIFALIAASGGNCDEACVNTVNAYCSDGGCF